MGTFSGKGLYLTVYPLCRPNTDTVWSLQQPKTLELKLVNCWEIVRAIWVQFWAALISYFSLTIIKIT